MLNNYFASQAFVTDRPLSQLLPVQYVLNSIEILRQDVSDVRRNLNINKSCGPDLVNPRSLKKAGSALARPLSMIFNRSLDQGYFPAQWKRGNVCPIHKKDDKSLPSTYRPITLLSILGKIMERCVHKYLYNFIIIPYSYTLPVRIRTAGWLGGWLFWVYRPFKTVFQSVSGHLPEREGERKEK